MILVIGGVFLIGEHDHTGGDESRDVVDVAVRVVADAALAEPDRLADAEAVAERPLVAGAVEPRIAYLFVREEPLLGHEHGPLAVGLDPTSLEHETRARIRTCGLEARQPRDALDRATDLGVTREVRVL